MRQLAPAFRPLANHPALRFQSTKADAVTEKAAASTNNVEYDRFCGCAEKLPHGSFQPSNLYLRKETLTTGEVRTSLVLYTAIHLAEPNSQLPKSPSEIVRDEEALPDSAKTISHRKLTHLANPTLKALREAYEIERARDYAAPEDLAEEEFVYHLLEGRRGPSDQAK